MFIKGMPAQFLSAVVSFLLWSAAQILEAYLHNVYKWLVFRLFEFFYNDIIYWAQLKSGDRYRTIMMAFLFFLIGIEAIFLNSSNFKYCYVQ